MVDTTEISAMVAAAGVLIGVVLTVMQVRDLVKTRHTDIIMRLYAIFESMEFQRVYQQVTNLEFEDYEDFMKKHAEDNELRAAIWSVGTFFEGIGVLAKRKVIKMDLVDDLFPLILYHEVGKESHL